MASIHFRVYENDKEAEREVLNGGGKPPYTNTCFSGYEVHYQGDDSNGNIYFGIFAHPNISKLVDEINDNFCNINIVIVGMKEKSFRCNGYFNGTYKEAINSNYCLFKVELDDRYSAESKYLLTLTLAEFIRVYSPYYQFSVNMVDVETDFIDNCLRVQNTPAYGAWLCCDPKRNCSCSRDTFNKFDDIELMNTISEGRVNFEFMPSVHKLIRVLEGSTDVEYLRRDGSILE